MTFKIEKGVALIGPRRKYPFEKMEVGDSFFVHVGPSESLRQLQSRLSGSVAVAHQKLKGRRFTQRRMSEGVRVWRTE